MLFYAGKFLAALIAPLGLAVLALFVAIPRLRGIRRHLALIAMAAILVCGCHRFEQFALGTLEHPFAAARIETAPTVQAIVVLGGYIRFQPRTPRSAEIGGTGDRLLAAFQLFKAGKAPLILLTGGNVPFLMPDAPQPESTAAKALLEQWGVPPSAIRVEGASQSTRENALFSRRLLAPQRIDRVLLVTSAFHMRRALGTFRKVGFDPTPFAADFMAEADPGDLAISLIPDASALGGTGIATREWLGLASYRLRGWLD